MQWCALSLIYRVNIKTNPQKQSNCQWLITLSCDMQHVNITLIPKPWISTLANQIFYHEKVSKKWSKMHGSKTVITSTWHIYPFFQILPISLVLFVLNIWIVMKAASISIFQNVITQNLDRFHWIFKSSKMQRIESSAIIKQRNVNRLLHNLASGTCIGTNPT